MSDVLSAPSRQLPTSRPGALRRGSYHRPSAIWQYIQTYIERDVRQLTRIQDLRSFETFVALCAARHGQELNRAALARDAGVSQPTIKTWTDLYFWRSHDGLEVDLLIRIGPRLYPVEIKLTATPSARHLRPLEKFKSLAGPAVGDTGVLVCRVPQVCVLPSGNLAIPWSEFPGWLHEKLEELGSRKSEQLLSS